MTLEEAEKFAMDARAQALSALETSDKALREVYEMALRRAELAEYRFRVIEQQNERLKAQLDEAWAMLAKVTDANPNT